MPIDPFVSRLVAMLTPLGPVEPRAMFGGHGLYLDGRHFAIVHRGCVYFRVDAATAATFAAGGGQPFRYRRNGKPIIMASYHEPTAASLGTGETLLPWAQRGIDAAHRGSAGRPRRVQRPQRTGER
jgi:DNA transformation protein and related proteins